MRNIKFRVWDKGENKWIAPEWYGDICVGERLIIVADNKPRNGGYYVYRKRLLDKFYYTVEQYTGFKDKNGVEIYEGDILTWKKYYAYAEGGVKQNNIIVKIPSIYRHPISDNNPSDYDIEVIGNIHENPELLQED